MYLFTKNRIRFPLIAVVSLLSANLLGIPLFNGTFYGTTVYAAAPVIDGSSRMLRTAEEQKEMSDRLNRVERMLKGQGMSEVFNRLETLQREIQQLTGKLEVQSHLLETMKKRQRELYIDTDRRISRIEKGGIRSGTAATTSAPTPLSSATAVTSGTQTRQSRNDVTQTPAASTPRNNSPMASNGGRMKQNTITPSRPSRNPASLSGQRRPTKTASRGSKLERDAYERAFNLLKKGRYTMASASFRAFLEAYPGARYAGNAQYWLGEANYVQRKYSAAISEFGKVVRRFPKSPKLPDALLKMGFAYNELGQKKQAIKSLETILQKYGSSTAARLAKKRLISIKSSR